MHKSEELKGGLGMPPTSGMPMKPMPEGMKAPPMPSTVPPQLAKDFLSVVKKGNMGEISSFISKAKLLIVDQYNIDITKIVDDNFRQTCLFYATQIKDNETYS
jgi:hypothetical protein